MIKFKPTVPLLFYAKGSIYVVGEGYTTTWTKVITDPLYCEWTGGYGDRALSAQSLGVSDMATIRTFYHPDVYSKLIGSQVIIIKNADTTAIVNGEPDKSNVNCYELWGGVDNVAEENQYMEFRVRRYEPK